MRFPSTVTTSLLLLYSLIPVDGHVLARRHPAPAGVTKTCWNSIKLLPQVTSNCKTFLSSEGSLTVTSTATVTSSSTLPSPTKTSTSTSVVTVYTPTVTSTATSTFYTSTVTTVPVTVTSTATTTETTFTLTSTTVVGTVTALVTSTPMPRRRSLPEEAKREEKDSFAVVPALVRGAGPIAAETSSSLEKRTSIVPAIFQAAIKLFGTKTVTDACLYIVYGASPEPTTIVTSTKTATVTPTGTVQTTVTTTSTTSIATTVTTTSTVTVFSTTVTSSPTVTSTVTSTVTPTTTLSVTSTVPAATATGTISFSQNGNTGPVYAYYDFTGGHIASDGRGDAASQYCYVVANQAVYDCTASSPGNIFGTYDGVSYVFVGNSNDGATATALQCSIASVADADGATPLSCIDPAHDGEGEVDSQFYSCPSQDALYYPTDTDGASYQGCSPINLYFHVTSLSA